MSKPVDYCEKVHNIDDLFTKFDRERNHFITLVNTDPNQLVDRIWSKDSLISVDRGCLFQMGRHNCGLLKTRIESNGHPLNPMIRKLYACSSCVHLNRLKELSRQNFQLPFHIESGELKGKKLVLIDKEVHRLHFSLNNQSMNMINKVGNIAFFGSDSYTNDLLINWYLDWFTTSYDMPTIQHYYTSFVCGNHGYHLTDVTSKERPDIDTVLLQLVSTLHLLRHIELIFNQIDKSTILFVDEPFNYQYQDLQMSGKVCLKLAGFQHASITIRIDTSTLSPEGDQYARFFNDSGISSLRQLIQPLKSQKGESCDIYRLPRGISLTYLQLQTHLSSMGLFHYYPAIELYLLLFVLVEQGFKIPDAVWDVLILPQERSKLPAILEEISKQGNVNHLHLLSQLSIKCQAIDQLLELLHSKR